MTRNAAVLPIIGLLGALSLAACNARAPGSATQAGDFNQVAQVIARREDRVTADELAHWIIGNQQDYMLVDVRSAAAFAGGHIDGARNLAVPELLAPETLKTLPKDHRIIVYSQGSETAAQAVVLLRLAGYRADLLLGGYDFWSQQVLNPRIEPSAADGEFARVSERQAIACYFVGGNAAAQPVPAQPVKPAFVPPVSQPAVPAPPPAFHEGC